MLSADFIPLTTLTLIFKLNKLQNYNRQKRKKWSYKLKHVGRDVNVLLKCILNKQNAIRGLMYPRGGLNVDSLELIRILC